MTVAPPDQHQAQACAMLIELSHELDALGEALCRDPVVVVRHVSLLQAIDLIAQKQRSLAEILLADCPVSAVKALGLDDLRIRFGHSAAQSTLTFTPEQSEGLQQ